MLYISCHDALMRVWSLSTGILERVIPHSPVYGTSVNPQKSFNGVECIDSTIGGATVHLIRLSVSHCALQIKQAWAESSVSCASLERFYSPSSSRGMHHQLLMKRVPPFFELKTTLLICRVHSSAMLTRSLCHFR